ncbi:hypothetical protein CCACVL1_18120 [Corchorus capsularis]|uniref:Uncharacterized protein n=1 Tax=Corchorus capsularis TaxID=210143 RepID=A0A1R3HML2_COCAP|nr:hypothetical protein CCACVL1_18120 [Corchorus capsularis]
MEIETLRAICREETALAVAWLAAKVMRRFAEEECENGKPKPCPKKEK